MFNFLLFLIDFRVASNFIKCMYVVNTKYNIYVNYKKKKIQYICSLKIEKIFVSPKLKLHQLVKDLNTFDLYGKRNVHV